MYETSLHRLLRSGVLCPRLVVAHGDGGRVHGSHVTDEKVTIDRNGVGYPPYPT
jgi:hypothetical protein